MVVISTLHVRRDLVQSFESTLKFEAQANDVQNPGRINSKQIDHASICCASMLGPTLATRARTIVQDGNGASRRVARSPTPKHLLQDSKASETNLYRCMLFARTYIAADISDTDHEWKSPTFLYPVASSCLTCIVQPLLVSLGMLSFFCWLTAMHQAVLRPGVAGILPIELVSIIAHKSTNRRTHQAVMFGFR